MNQLVKIKPPDVPPMPSPEWFDANAAYNRERAYSKKLERLLSRAVALLDMETTRREIAGEDVAPLRAFIREARLA